MKVKVSFLHCQGNDQLRFLIESKAAKIIHQLGQAQCTLQISYNSKNWFEANVHVINPHIRVNAVGKGESMSESVDDAMQKAQKQVSKWKDKVTNHKKNSQTKNYFEHLSVKYKDAA